MARTAYELVKSALMLVGAIDAGNPPQAWEGNLGLSTLNRMRSSWNASGLTCYGSAKVEITATGAASYTMGTGGTISTRPFSIVSLFYRTGDQEREIAILNAEDWREFSQKTDAGDPEYAFIDRAYPLETVYLHPRPQDGKIVATYRTPFAEIAHLSDPLPDPPEYDEAFAYNLAVRLGAIPGLGSVREEVALLAKKTYDNLVTRVAVANMPQKRYSAAFHTTSDGTGL